MAWKRQILSLAAAGVMWLAAALPVSAIDTVPDLPPLAEKPETGSQVSSGSPGPEEEGIAPEQYDDSRMIFIGIGAWVGFLTAAAMVAVVIIKSKKRPPGGGPPGSKGRLGRAAPENDGYKERILSDQHYRKY